MKAILLALSILLLGGCYTYPTGTVYTDEQGDKYVKTRTVIILESPWEVKCAGSCLERLNRK